MRCIWCERETTLCESAETDDVRYANLEHIFPVAVGGKRGLKLGEVCRDCNKKLGAQVDEYLKIGDFSMMYQYQVVDGIPGRVRNAEDRRRKLAEKLHLKHHSKSGAITRSEDGEEVTISDFFMYEHDAMFVRALHKCLANSIVNAHGGEQFIAQHQLLKKYILGKAAEDHNDWAVGLAYANMSERMNFEPFCGGLFSDDAGRVIAGVLVFPSLLAVVGAFPDVMSKNFLHKSADMVLASVDENSRREPCLDVRGYFRADGFWNYAKRKPVHPEVGLVLVKKHKPAEPIPGVLQPLAICPCCGQRNPVGIRYKKSHVLSLSNNRHGYGKNDWNVYEMADMQLLFGDTLNIPFDKLLLDHAKTGMLIDATVLAALQMEWTPTTIHCIGCGHVFESVPSDYFF
jgi:hypothetical protein